MKESPYTSRRAIGTIVSMHDESNGDWLCEWLDGLRHAHRFLHHFPVFAFCKRLTIGRPLPGFLRMVSMVKQSVCAHGKSVTSANHSLTMRNAPPIRWDVDVALSFCADSGHDKDYIETLEAVKHIMNELTSS